MLGFKSVDWWNYRQKCVPGSRWDELRLKGIRGFLTGQRSKSLKQAACRDGCGRDLVSNSRGGAREKCIRKV